MYASRQFRSLAVTAPQTEPIFLKKRTTLLNTDTNNHDQVIHIAEITFDGFPCLRYFDAETGKLCVVGPKGSRKACRRYVRKYEKLCQSHKFRGPLSQIRPGTPMNMKLHALLHLIDEHMDDIAAGMPITEDHFITVLNSFTFHPEVSV